MASVLMGDPLCGGQRVPQIIGKDYSVGAPFPVLHGSGKLTVICRLQVFFGTGQSAFSLYTEFSSVQCTVQFTLYSA